MIHRTHTCTRTCSDRRRRRASAPVLALALLLTLLGLAGAPAPAEALVSTSIPITARVNLVGASGQPTLGVASRTFVTGDGRYVFFSTAQAMVADDTNGVLDVYRRDRMTSSTRRVSVDGERTQRSTANVLCGISTDGRYIAWRASSPALGSEDNHQIYRRDLQEAITSIASASGGTPAYGGAVEGQPCPISDDGNRVAFATNAFNFGTDTNAATDIYLRRFSPNALTRVSVGVGGTEPNGNSLWPDLAGNGGSVAFASLASNLVAADSNSRSDVFVRSLVDNTTERVSVQADGDQGNEASTKPAISANGRYVAFESTATDLVAGDDNAKIDVFRKDLQTEAIVVASRAPNGALSTGTSQDVGISPDGRWVVFISNASNLYPADVNGTFDVYRRDLELEKTDLASRRATSINSGNDASNALPSVSSDGSVVAFPSHATDLVPGDTNGQYDLFVRDFSLDITPFATAKAYVSQQLLDFGGVAPTNAEADAAALQLTTGLLSPDTFIVTQARKAPWATKRAPLIRLYWAFFLRTPDPSGMTYWTNQLTNGKTLAVVAKQFSQSSEFQTKYGTKTNEQFVTLIYQNIFDRDPDPSGLAYWTNKLNTKQKTRGDVMVNFSESSEGKRVLAPQTDTVLVYLGMIRTMPPKNVFDNAVANQQAGSPIELFVNGLRTFAPYLDRLGL